MHELRPVGEDERRLVATGMTVAALKASYDQSLDASILSLGALAATTYCVTAESPNDPTKTAAKAGPSAPIVIGATCP